MTDLPARRLVALPVGHQRPDISVSSDNRHRIHQSVLNRLRTGAMSSNFAVQILDRSQARSVDCGKTPYVIQKGESLQETCYQEPRKENRVRVSSDSYCGTSAPALSHTPAGNSEIDRIQPQPRQWVLRQVVR